MTQQTEEEGRGALHLRIIVPETEGGPFSCVWESVATNEASRRVLLKFGQVNIYIQPNKSVWNSDIDRNGVSEISSTYKYLFLMN